MTPSPKHSPFLLCTFACQYLCCYHSQTAYPCCTMYPWQICHRQLPVQVTLETCPCPQVPPALFAKLSFTKTKAKDQHPSAECLGAWVTNSYRARKEDQQCHRALSHSCGWKREDKREKGPVAVH